MMPAPDLNAFFAQLCAISGEVARQYYRQPFQIISKGDATPVTIADRTIEERLRDTIEKAFPADGIIGEEFGEKTGTSGRIWVLDPIDGTKSFTIGRPTFTTLIALCEDGVPVAGVIDQPITGDRWVGIDGQPTRWNDMPIRVRACPDMAQAITGIGAPDQIGLPNYETLKNASRYMIYQGDAFLYGLLAMGQMDVVVEAMMGVYDIMALVPVVKNAGGIITDWNGQPHMIGGSDKVLAAGDEGLHAHVMQLLSKQSLGR